MSINDFQVAVETPRNFKVSLGDTIYYTIAFNKGELCNHIRVHNEDDEFCPFTKVGITFNCTTAKALGKYIPIAEKAYTKNGGKSLRVELNKDQQIHLKIDKSEGQMCYSIVQAFNTKNGNLIFKKPGQNGRIDLNEKQFEALKKNWSKIESKMNELLDDKLLLPARGNGRKTEENSKAKKEKIQYIIYFAVTECLHENLDEETLVTMDSIGRIMGRIKGKEIIAKCYETNALRLKQLEATWSDLLDGIANCYSKTAYGAISRLMTGNESKKDDDDDDDNNNDDNEMVILTQAYNDSSDNDDETNDQKKRKIKETKPQKKNQPSPKKSKPTTDDDDDEDDEKKEEVPKKIKKKNDVPQLKRQNAKPI